MADGEILQIARHSKDGLGVRALVWVPERIIEAILANLLLYLMAQSDGATQSGSWPNEFLGIMALLSFFYIAFGYIFSTAVVRIILPTREMRFQLALMGAVFLAHSGLFIILLQPTGVSDAFPPLPLVSGGLAIVCFCTWLGEIAKRRLAHHPLR